jgi:putative SOS response-associated peptidase YedK
MILRPYSADLMRAYPVGPRVGNVRNNDAALLNEISIAA